MNQRILKLIFQRRFLFIQYLIGLQEFRNQWETDMQMHDTKVMKAFRNYVEKYGLEVDLDEIKRISDQADAIILSLKRFYNRPRPKVLADKLDIGFSFFPLKKCPETLHFCRKKNRKNKYAINLLFVAFSI